MSVSIVQTRQVLAAGLAVCLVGTPAFAQGLSSQFSFKVVEAGADGEELLVTRDSVKPDEVIHYQLRHVNETANALDEIVIAAPLPEGVTLVPEFQSSSVASVFEVQAELDPDSEGLEWSTLPALRNVVDETGASHLEPLPTEAIKAVRWSFSAPLDAGDIALNAYRVRVN